MGGVEELLEWDMGMGLEDPDFLNVDTIKNARTLWRFSSF